jgi:hypothetical protein
MVAPPCRSRVMRPITCTRAGFPTRASGSHGGSVRGFSRRGLAQGFVPRVHGGSDGGSDGGSHNGSDGCSGRRFHRRFERSFRIPVRTLRGTRRSVGYHGDVKRESAR